MVSRTRDGPTFHVVDLQRRHAWTKHFMGLYVAIRLLFLRPPCSVLVPVFRSMLYRSRVHSLTFDLRQWGRQVRRQLDVRMPLFGRQTLER
jgi:hypothetical protein